MNRYVVGVLGVLRQQPVEPLHDGLSGFAGEDPVVVLLAGPALGDMDDVGVGRRPADEIDEAVFTRAGVAVAQAGQQQVGQLVAHAGPGGQGGVESVIDDHDYFLPRGMDRAGVLVLEQKTIWPSAGLQ